MHRAFTDLWRLSRANGGISLSATGCYGDRTFDIDGSSVFAAFDRWPPCHSVSVWFQWERVNFRSGCSKWSGRVTDERISEYLGAISRELDIDGDGESKPLTDGLLLIRYLFGFSGDS